MSKVEILFYSPIDLDGFIDFCIRGKEVSKGVAAKDEDGRDIFGVISWLNGWGVQEAHFFHQPKDTPEDRRISFFMALVRKREGDDQERPWFITDLSSPPTIVLEPDIPGIDKHLLVDGELGMLPGFLPIGELLATIAPDPVLDAEFVAQRKKVQGVLKRLEADEAGTRRFLAALRGEKESKPAELFKELNFSLRD
jgi:hypothetical protein